MNPKHRIRGIFIVGAIKTFEVVIQILNLYAKLRHNEGRDENFSL